MDRGAWWATVHGVAKSQTRLKILSSYERTKCIAHARWMGRGIEFHLLVGESLHKLFGPFL